MTDLNTKYTGPDGCVGKQKKLVSIQMACWHQEHILQGFPFTHILGTSVQNIMHVLHIPADITIWLSAFPIRCFLSESAVSAEPL